VHDNFLGVLRRRVAGVRAAVDGLRLRDDEWRRCHAVALVDYDRAAATSVVWNDLERGFELGISDVNNYQDDHSALIDLIH